MAKMNPSIWNSATTGKLPTALRLAVSNLLAFIRVLTSMRYAMHRAFPTLALLCLIVFPLRAWCAEPHPVRIPVRGEPGWKFGPPGDQSQAAPAGYEGRTDTSLLTADGNIPATAGQHIVAKLKLANQIKTCPLADGTAGGEGEFSITVDSMDAQPNGTSKTHIEMRATAKYKGQVGDSGYLEGLVNADVDYTYTQTGTIRDASGALLSTSVPPVPQHIRIPIAVSKDLGPPDFGAFSGGDPTIGHYAEAHGVGMALTYWAGVFYSVAQTKWMQGQCAEIVFDPPSDTVALGAQTTVKAAVKTKAGESVPGQFGGGHARSGTLTPLGGLSGVGAPLKFTYIAPDRKAKNAGFNVSATSRAGAAKGEWNAGLGTGWSGQITCSRTITGDAGTSELLDWSNSSVLRLTIEVKDGKGRATGYGDVHSMFEMRKKRAVGGQAQLVHDQSGSDNGTVEGTSPAKVDVFLDQTKGTYSISLNLASPIVGKSDSGAPLSVDDGICLGTGLYGKFSEPNHVQGTVTDTKSGVGKSRNSIGTSITTWNLARQGSSK